MWTYYKFRAKLEVDSDGYIYSTLYVCCNQWIIEILTYLANLAIFMVIELFNWSIHALDYCCKHNLM